MLVMFFLIIIVASSVMVLLVTIITPLATQRIMHVLPVHHQASLPGSEEVAPVRTPIQQPHPHNEIRVAQQQALKGRNVQSLHQQAEEIPLEEKHVLEANLCLYTRHVPKVLIPNPYMVNSL